MSDMDHEISEEENEYWRDMCEVKGAIVYAKEYRDKIAKENDRPTYRWNTESHGVLGFIKWLESQLPDETKGGRDE